MKNLQIGRGWLDPTAAAPVFQRLHRGLRQLELDYSDNRQINMQIDRLMMIERNLIALAF